MRNYILERADIWRHCGEAGRVAARWEHHLESRLTAFAFGIALFSEMIPRSNIIIKLSSYLTLKNSKKKYPLWEALCFGLDDKAGNV